jgi:hypothetical protein
MNVEQLIVDKDEAVRLHRKYLEHRHHSGPAIEIDREVERLYRLISKGEVVIQGKGSVLAASIGEDRLPRLAISRADASACHLSIGSDGRAIMDHDGQSNWRSRVARTNKFQFAAGSFPGCKPGRYQAIAPHIPPDIRPRRGLENYTLLWEAVWEKAPPVDPYLLRQIGKSDFYAVVGAWDLTPVERAVMASRIPVQ